MRGMDGACWCPDLAPLKLTGDPWRSQVTFLCDGLRAEWVRLVQSPAVSCFPWLVEEALCWNSGLKDQSSLAHRRATWRDAQEWACKNGIIFSHRDAVCYCGITSLCWLTEQLSQGGLRDHAVMDGSPSWPRVRLAVSWPEQPRTPTDRYSHSLLDLFETMGKLNWHPAEWLLACQCLLWLEDMWLTYQEAAVGGMMPCPSFFLVWLQGPQLIPGGEWPLWWSLMKSPP